MQQKLEDKYNFLFRTMKNTSVGVEFNTFVVLEFNISGVVEFYISVVVVEFNTSVVVEFNISVVMEFETCFLPQDTLFPYVVENIDSYLQETWDTNETKEDVEALRLQVSQMRMSLCLPPCVTGEV